MNHYKTVKSDNKVILSKKYGPIINRETTHSLVNTMDNVIIRSVVLCECTNPNCHLVETAERQFKRCQSCKTIYCSTKCSADDWKNGKHKDFCKYESYSIQRDLYYKNLFRQKKLTDEDMLFGNQKYEEEWKKIGKKYWVEVPKEYKKKYRNYY